MAGAPGGPSKFAVRDGLIWRASPGLVASDLVLRFLEALIPLGMLAVSRRIIDGVNIASGHHAASTQQIWHLLWIEFGLAAGSL